MNLDKIFSVLKKFVNNYLKLILYSFFVLVLLFTLYFTYTNVYKTVISANEIKESEIIAKKQKVDVNLFKEIETKIKSKNDKSINKIPNIFQ